LQKTGIPAENARSAKISDPQTPRLVNPYIDATQSSLVYSINVSSLYLLLTAKGVATDEPGENNALKAAD